ncbi:trehalose-phosphatase [Caulobacter sp. 17J65-9]|uniref:trehalose-phosphatase n=1 Tax=Caulobacter sp. 17J65-9 TaxID=2709382 RepID=UPI0013CC4BF3|nr:trehalose-phosphatase [Caulobacter sp. 17J65-9]NEX93926.1 trehalose-phosphatase [Caulobacter sp. 17J65-9]
MQAPSYERGSPPPPEPLGRGRDSLFLDLDGTLVGIRARPEDVVAEAELLELLPRLADWLEGRVAVVSGRSVADVDRILQGRVRCVAGVHGLEWRSEFGGPVVLAAERLAPVVAGELKAFAENRPGLLVEDKGLGVALHYRGAPEREAEAVAFAERLAAEHGLTAQHGAKVVEVRSPAADKGEAIARFLTAPPFAGTRPVFVGDDVTDEDGFRRAAELGGLGVLVGPERPTAARCRLPDEGAVRVWLQRSLGSEA